jgi:type II secretory ATPase GspE/PulE/Tfp pilus assembly ATPase PilB-like protein
MIQQKIRIGDLLISNGLITEEQVDKAFEIQKASGGLKRIGQVLIEEGYVDEETILLMLAHQLKVDYQEPGTVSVNFSVAEKLPLNILKRAKAVPVLESESLVTVLFSDPLDFEAQDNIQRLIPNKPIKVAITTEMEIQKILTRLETLESLKEILNDVYKEISSDSNFTRASGDESAIMRLIKTIVQAAIRKKGSDIHIEPSLTSCHVRVRIDGFLQELFSFESDIYPPLTSRIKLLGELDIAERRKPQDGRFSLEIDQKEYDFRLSTLPIVTGESMVMRILDKSKVLFKLDEIGFSDRNTEKFRKAMKSPYGIIFVTGPTGSGKTTSLYAGLNELKNTSTKIITVEDPIEYQMNMIQQVQVNEKAELGFSEALRSILRQDPDVILIGESRDLETLSIAVQAALTGHLVFTTLHTNDALSAITRIIDMGIEPFLIANAIVAIQAQRLVRNVCQYCKVDYNIPDNLLIELQPYIGKMELNFQKGTGCKKCSGSGYLGRTILSEVLEFNEELSTGIIKGLNKQELLEIALKNGFETIYADGIQKAAQGVTTIEEVMRVAKL